MPDKKSFEELTSKITAELKRFAEAFGSEGGDVESDAIGNGGQDPIDPMGSNIESSNDLNKKTSLKMMAGMLKQSMAKGK